MSRAYPCVHFKNGLCKLFTDDVVISHCLKGPCKQQKPSNADRIRAMSDKELADYLATIGSEANNGVIYSDRPEEWLEWLKQPTKED